MSAAYLIVTVITIVATAWAAAADFTRARFVLATMTEVGVPRSWLNPLGAAKAAGAAGLLIGLLGVRPLGVAAAIGLALFFIGALITHIRARVFHNITAPGFYLVLAVASMALAIAH